MWQRLAGCSSNPLLPLGLDSSAKLLLLLGVATWLGSGPWNVEGGLGHNLQAWPRETSNIWSSCLSLFANGMGRTLRRPEPQGGRSLGPWLIMWKLPLTGSSPLDNEPQIKFCCVKPLRCGGWFTALGFSPVIQQVKKEGGFLFAFAFNFIFGRWPEVGKG